MSFTRRILTTGVAGLCLIAPALAQEDEIIVTAERRAQGLADTPVSISSLQDLDAINANHPAEALARVPGVLINSNSGQESLTAIRSPVLTGGAGAGSFLYLENGVPLRAPGFANVNGFLEATTDLASRIEVVRGPSGAFYGANAIHGVINVISPHPQENTQFAEVSLSEFHRKAEAGMARYARGRGFYAGLAVHDDTGFRAASGVDQQQGIFRYVDERGAWAQDTILSVTNLNQETAGYAEGPDAYRDDAIRKANPNPEAYRDAKAVRLQSTLSREVESGTVTITPYARWTEMDFKMHFLPSGSVEENGHWSLGAQSAYRTQPADRLSLTWGLDGEYTEGYLTEIQDNPDIFSYRQGVHYDYDVTASSLSPFVHGDFALSDSLSLIGGLRADWTRYDYTNNTQDGLLGRNLRPADRSDEFLTVSPKLTLQHTGAGGLTWVSLTRGARPPQTTDLYRLQSNETVGLADSETIDALEAGWRGDIGDRLTASLAAFWMEKDNFYFRDADGFNVADGETRHVGVEVEILLDLTECLSLAANGTFAEHTYQFDRPVSGQQSEAIAKGDYVDTAPKTLGGARLNWTPDALPVLGPGLSAELEWVHVGEYFMDAANTVEYPGHDIFHLRAAKQMGFFTLRGAVRNLFDERYAERADYAFGTERYFPDEGRTLTVSLRLEN